MKKCIDLTGMRFGRLTVIKKAKRGKFKELRVICCCDCGNTKNVSRSHLLYGDIKSCGCLLKDFKKTHGMSYTRTYRSWECIISRCKNKNNDRFKDYGGRGIMVCDRWLDFELFFKDMGNRPKNKTIDRIDNNGNYEPNNCCWSTPKEQSRNSRSNRIIKYRGASKCLVEWSEYLKINYDTLKARIDRGWSLKRAFEA